MPPAQYEDEYEEDEYYDDDDDEDGDFYENPMSSLQGTFSPTLPTTVIVFV
jgi:hypothetical protein